MAEQNCIIIGASHAASQCAMSLRQGGYEGSVTVIGDEAELPYHRPPLSKDFLSGQKDLEAILLRPAALYADNNIEMKLSTRVSKIDRDAKTVTTDKGETLAYNKLVLCTGARVRKLPVPGADLPNVFYLRDSADVMKIKGAVGPGKRAVIIGGGYIGLETAASLRKLGVEVTVLEAMERILQRVTGPIMSDFYRRVHSEEGVNVLETVGASELAQDGDALNVLTGCGKNIPADFVIIGIGVIPNTELASEAGLDVGNGVNVNEFCQTSDPDIYAAGDVTFHHNPIYDMSLRLESVPNATEQAKTVAAHINGTPKPYNSLPWFWSDQYDLKLQIAGLSIGFDDIVIRGTVESGRSFAAFYFKGNKFIAVDAINSPREFAMGRMLLGQGKNLDKSLVGDEDVDLKTCVI